MLGDLISQDMFGYPENERKWRKVENYIERRNLESSTIRKCIKKFLNESIKFLFIGQGQVDTWHHLRGLPEASSPRNLEKIRFCTSPNKFARLCEMENASTLFSSSWSVSHDYVKISHGHVKLLFTFPLVCYSQNLSCFISHDYAKIPHGHAKLKNMPFQLLFAIFPISSFLIHLHHLQFSFKAWSKCISSFSSFSLCTLLHFIFHLSLHA